MHPTKDFTVEISSSCYYTILRAVIEGWPKEVLGDLIGKKSKEHFLLIDAYHYLTATRKNTYTYWGNNAARKRVVDVARTINTMGGLGNSIMGSFHSHVIGRDEGRASFLSPNDLEFFGEEMFTIGRKEAVAIVASLKIVDYKYPQTPGEYAIECKKSLRTVIKSRENPWRGYDIIISAFVIFLLGNKKPIKAEIRRRKK